MMRRITVLGNMALVLVLAFSLAERGGVARAADKSPSASGETSSPKTIEGQVYITLANRDTLKLSRVEVMLVPSNSATQALALRAKTRATINTLMEEFNKHRLLERGLELLYPKVAAEKAEDLALLKECESLQNEIRSRLKNEVYKGAEKKKWEEQLAELTPECESSRRSALIRDADMKRMVNITFELIESRAAVEDQILKLASHKTFFTESKFDIAQKTTTDAEGHFKVLAPTNQSYFLFAWAERNLPSGDEQYAWAIPLTNFNGRISLNNANLLSEPAGEHSAFVIKLKAANKKAQKQQ